MFVYETNISVYSCTTIVKLLAAREFGFSERLRNGKTERISCVVIYKARMNLSNTELVAFISCTEIVATVDR